MTGIGNYSGSYNAVSFNIVSWDYNDLQARIEDQVYTGKALKPQITFYTGGEAVALKQGTAVKVVYKDNKDAGTPVPKVKVGKSSLKAGRDFTVSYLRNGVKGEAQVIITGIGNYTGECRKSFIVQ